MAKHVEFDPIARTDGFDWYAQRSIRAAIGFAAEVEAALRSITSDPNRFARTFAGCQICRVKRYPYGVVYYQSDHAIHVVAIAHAKRRPEYWIDRL
jgi:plasmid stabilization system protein ParE